MTLHRPVGSVPLREGEIRGFTMLQRLFRPTIRRTDGSFTAAAHGRLVCVGPKSRPNGSGVQRTSPVRPSSGEQRTHRV